LPRARIHRHAGLEVILAGFEQLDAEMSVGAAGTATIAVLQRERSFSEG
jgi:hypothetical protein